MSPNSDAARSALSARVITSQIFEKPRNRVQIFENCNSPESTAVFGPPQKSRARSPWLPPSGPPDHEDTPIDVLPRSAAVEKSKKEKV